MVLEQEKEKMITVCPVSPFKHATMYGLLDPIVREIAEKRWSPMLANVMPVRTTAAILRVVYERLLKITMTAVDYFEPASPITELAETPDATDNAPAHRTRSKTSPSSCPALVFNTVVRARLPDAAALTTAYSSDLDCVRLMDMVNNPSLVTKKYVQNVNYAYRGPLRRRLIVLQQGFLVIKEAGKHQAAYRHL